MTGVFDPLLAANQAFAAHHTHGQPLRGIRSPVLVLTCVDPRTDPAGFLGVRPGQAVVMRNAGGRVTPEVITDIGLLGELTASLGMVEADGPLFQVAVIHHTDCGTARLANEDFRSQVAERTGRSDQELLAQAVVDPHETVRADVERLRAAPGHSPRIDVGGYVYDLGTGLVSVVVPPARQVAAPAAS